MNDSQEWKPFIDLYNGKSLSIAPYGLLFQQAGLIELNILNWKHDMF